MSSGSIKDQLKSLTQSGKLVVRASEVSVQNTKRKPKPVAKAKPPQEVRATEQPVTEAETPPPSLKWTVTAEKMLAQVTVYSNKIPVLSSVRDQDFNVSLNHIEATTVKIHEKIQTEQENSRKRELTTARRAAETLLNYLRTVREAAAVNDVQAEHFTEVNRTINQHIKELQSCLTAVRASDLPVVKVDKAMQNIEESNIGRYRIFQRQLDKTLAEAKDKVAVVIDLPIIPIIGGGITTQDLLNAHVAVEPMAGYSVLLKQRLIGLNPGILEKKGFSKEEYVQTVIAQLNQRSKQNFMLVMDKPVTDKKHKMYWYWICPDKVLTAITTAGNKQAAITEWSFAF